MNRRTFLALSAAATACTRAKDDSADTAPQGSPPRDPEPDEWVPEGVIDLDAFAWGIQTGDAGTDRVFVSVRSTETRLEVVLMVADGDGWVEERRLEVDCDHRATFVLDGLVADTAYRLAAWGASGRSEVARFRTALAADQDRLLVFGMTSCVGRPNAPWPNLAFVPGEELDFMGFLGDLVYADGSQNLQDFRDEYDQAYSTEGLRLATNSTSIIATWDDHEVDNNWTEEPPEDGVVAAATQAFQEACPQDTSGTLWRALRYGAVADVFVLDSRGERIPDEGVYLSPEQLQWLIDEVQSSTARFKLIFNSVPITDFEALLGGAQEQDRWTGFPEQREAILSALEGIPGVVWLSGDLHFAALTWVGQPGDLGQNQPEVLCGPSGSRRNPFPALYTGDRTQFPELLSEWNWVRFEADATLGTLRVQFIGDDGGTLADHTLSV